MIDERRRHVRRLDDLSVLPAVVEEPAHRLGRVLGGDGAHLVALHEVVEVAEVVHHLLVGEGVAGPQHPDALDDPAVLPDVPVEDHRLEHRGDEVHLVRIEALHQPEVEERHLAARLEQVVARVGIAVEGVQSVEAAEHEAEDRLGGQVALLLAPGLHLVEADALGQLGGEHPLGAQLVDDRGHVDERMALVVVGRTGAGCRPRGRSPAPRRAARGAPRPVVPARAPGASSPWRRRASRRCRGRPGWRRRPRGTAPSPRRRGRPW